MTLTWELLVAVLAAAALGAVLFLGRGRAGRGRREHRERLETLLEHLPVMVQAFDGEGRAVFWNRECERALGYRAGEVLGDTTALDRLVPDAARDPRARRVRPREPGPRRGGGCRPRSGARGR